MLSKICLKKSLQKWGNMGLGRLNAPEFK